MIFCATLFFLLQSPTLPGNEGNLKNESFVPRLDEASTRSWQQAKEALEQGNTKPFEQFWNSLQLDSDSMVFRDERLGIGLEEEIESFLENLEAVQLSRYRSSIEKISQRLESSAWKSESLRQLTLKFPASQAAAKAFFLLAEQAFEKGDFLAADHYYRRGKRFYLNSSLDKNWNSLRDRFPLSVRSTAPTCDSSTKLSTNSKISWKADSEEPAVFFRSHAQLSRKGFFLQTRRFLYEVDNSGKEVEKLDLDKAIWNLDSFIPSIWTEEESASPRQIQVVEIPGSTEMQSAGSLLLLHSHPSKPNETNVLAAMTSTSPRSLLWKRGGESDENPWLRKIQFSPDLLVLGQRIYVGAQKLEGEISSFLLCFETEKGEMLWKRFLCKSAPLRKESDRLLRTRLPSIPGTGPLFVEGSLIYLTNLGVLVAVDPIEGRTVWSWKYARNEGEEASEFPASLQNQDSNLRFTPADSRWLYSLNLAPQRNPKNSSLPSQSEVPKRLENKQFWVGNVRNRNFFWDDNQNFLFSPSSKHDATFRSVALSPQENALDWQLCPDQLYLLSSHALYNFDLNRELLLQNRTEFSRPSQESPSWIGEIQLFPFGLFFSVSNQLFLLEPSH